MTRSIQVDIPGQEDHKIKKKNKKSYLPEKIITARALIDFVIQ